MDELLKMIWNECVSRFGQSVNVDIHIDCDGVTITTENRGDTEAETIPHRKIEGGYAVRVDLPEK